MGVMKCRIGMLLVSVTCAVEAPALTWHFNTDGDTEGWIGRPMDSGLTTSLQPPPGSEVRDGVWRLTFPPQRAGRYPGMELLSPLLGEDSALFDRVRLRLRLVHDRPTEGVVRLEWVNSTNRANPGRTYPNPDQEESDLLTFFRTTSVAFTTNWQEVVISDLQTEVYASGPDLVKRAWEGELIDVRLTLSPATLPPAESPEAIELDWIEVTGVGEQVEGEVRPPRVEHWRIGTLFSLSTFLGLGDYSASGFVGPAERYGSLGDLDGDGDADLAAMWWKAVDVTPSSGVAVTHSSGWFTALNLDGEGRFGRPRSERSTTGWFSQVEGADVTGDGLMDVMVWSSEDYAVRMLENTAGGWESMVSVEDARPVGLGDADGDGDVDLWVTARSWAGTFLLRNDGVGGFKQLELSSELTEDGFVTWRLVQPAAGGQAVGVLLSRHGDEPGAGHMVVYATPQGEAVEEHLATDVWPGDIRYAGDVDFDGDTDLGVVDGQLGETQYGIGLSLLRNESGVRMVREGWFEEVIVAHDVEVFDVNGDGILDPVLTDENQRGQALIVGLGQAEGPPVLEGRYPLVGLGGPVLGGDVDGDGDVDVVVLEMAAVGGGGGVHVFRNQSVGQGTAVSESEEAVEPVALRLGQNYPNPFNPGTVIPFEVPAGEGEVQLRVYDTAGQRVQTLVAGTPDGGRQDVRWDGRDHSGMGVAAGVYLYRLEVGGSVAVGKMVKLE